MFCGGGAEGKVNEENISGALRGKKKNKNVASTYPPDTFSQVISLCRRNTICTRVPSQKNKSRYVPSACAFLKACTLCKWRFHHE